MFERFFQWGLRHGPRVLFGVAVLILLVEVGQAVNVLASAPTSRSLTYAGRLADGLAANWPNALPFLFEGLSSASLPFFCALVIQRLDLWRQRGATVAGTAPLPSSWLARHGARLLLALSLVYFLAAAVILAVWLAHVSLYMPWTGPLWSGGVLLFASLALDRLDRWLATVRPYSG